MTRGGKRDNAGRKSTWVSGVKFEDTTLIRIPISLKTKILEISHKLDAGEEIDLVSKSVVCRLEELEKEVALRSDEKSQLLEQLNECRLELEINKNEFSSKLSELEKQNSLLHDRLLAASQSEPPEVFVLTDSIVNSKDNVLVTNSNIRDEEKVTKSKFHKQLELPDFTSNVNNSELKPMSASALSKRLGKEDGFVKRKKHYYKDDLHQLSSVLKKYDPDKIAWEYSDLDKRYHPIYD